MSFQCCKLPKAEQAKFLFEANNEQILEKLFKKEEGSRFLGDCFRNCHVKLFFV